MGLKKYGTGKVLRDEDEERERKIAAKNFTDQDRKELEEELADPDKRRKKGDE